MVDPKFKLQKIMNPSVVLYVKRLLKHSSIYGVGTLLYRAVALVLVPLYVRNLSIGEYGDLELLFMTSSFLIMILQFGMGSAIFRSVIMQEDCPTDKIVSTAFFFLIFINTIIVTIICLFADTISIAIFETSARADVLRLLFVSDFFLVLAIIPQTKMRIDERSSLFTIVALANFIFGVLITIIFLGVFKWGIYGVILAQLVNSIIFSTVYIFVIREDIRMAFSFSQLIDMLGYGLPLVPASVAASILILSNRYFLKHLGSSEEVAIYSVGYRISQVIALMVNAFQMAWPTLLFTIYKEENAKETFAKLMNYFMFIMFTVSLLFSVYARELILIVTKATYLEAQTIIPVLVISNMFWGVFYMTSIGIHVKRKTIYIAIVTGIAAVINLILNYWLIKIPDFHLMGAALAGFGANLVVGIVTLIISLRFYYIRYEYSKIMLIFVVTVLVYLLSLFVPVENVPVYVTLLLKMLLIGFYFILLYVFRFFTALEIVKMKQLFKMLPGMLNLSKNNVNGGNT